MSRRRHEFNPFIVLSDVTMATLVVICCMLMIYLHFALRRADAAERWLNQYKEQLEHVKTNQRELQRAMDGIGQLGVGFPYSWSRGTTKVMFRICGDAYNNGRSYSLFDGFDLTDEGTEACQSFAKALLPPLDEQKYKTGKTSGYLTEIQIQGHCSDQHASDLWILSLKRALAVKTAMSSVSGFPTSLVTVSGAASNRRAYRSTDDYVKAEAKNRHLDWRKLSYNQVKQIVADLGNQKDSRGQLKKRDQLPDRIDITFVYAGEISDDSLVPARDLSTQQLLGTEIDTATDRFDPNNYSQAKWKAVFQDAATASPSPAVAPR